MKKIILLFTLLIVGNLIADAQDYQVTGIRGKCEIQKGNIWQSLETNVFLSDSSVLRGKENDVMVVVYSEIKGKGGLLLHKKDTPYPLNKVYNIPQSQKEKLLLSSVWDSMVAFVSFFTFSQPTYMTEQKHASMSKGSCGFPCDSLSASLLARMGGKFDIKANTAISDYDIFMRIDKTHFTVFNLSENVLYIVILQVSKENPTDIQSLSFYEENPSAKHLLEIEPNSITELHEKEIDTEFSYILLASKTEFNVPDLLNSITSDCDCTLKSDMPIGIYQVE